MSARAALSARATILMADTTVGPSGTPQKPGRRGGELLGDGSCAALQKAVIATSQTRSRAIGDLQKSRDRKLITIFKVAGSE